MTGETGRDVGRGAPGGESTGPVPEYLVGHLEDALARDPRVTEQGLRVRYLEEPPTVVVTGTVVDPSHKAAIADVVDELLPGVELRDETSVADYPEPAEPETLG